VPVLNPVWLVCSSAETGLSVCLIFRVVAFEPDHLALTFKCKHMCGDTVEVIAALVNICELHGFSYPVGRYGNNILVEKEPITVI